MLDPTGVVAAPLQQATTVDAASHWRLRYWSIFFGQASSLIGSELTQFVLLWWITDKTGSISALATAGLVALLPQALFGPLGGVLADRFSRRFLMIATDAVSALCMIVLIVLFVADRVELWHIYTMMFIRSAAQAFQSPAAAASTATLVPASFLPRAAGLNQTLQGMMTVAAAPLGALAIGVMPVGYALCIDVVTAVLGIVPLLIFAIPRPVVPERRKAGLWQDLWTDFREGIRTVWYNPALRQLYVLLAIIVMILMPAGTLLPLLVKQHFGGGAQQVALIEGLGGTGMVVGGIIVATISPKRLLAWILIGFAIMSLALGAVALMPSHMFATAVFFWIVSSISFTLGDAPLMTVVQTTVPHRLQGRALSLLTTMMALAAPIGLALVTPLGEMIGLRWLIVLLGFFGAVATLMGFLSPSLNGRHYPVGDLDDMRSRT